MSAKRTANRPIRKLLIANRGEIAVRVIRTARKMGIATVAVYSAADADAAHVGAADEAVLIGAAAPAESYLKIDAIISAARATGADAVHPGYGFLSENAKFAAACAKAGLTFVGPSEEAMAAMGDKAEAKRLMAAAGVPVVPGYDGADQSETTLGKQAARIGYPVMIKAVAGGGGRGMRLVEGPKDFSARLASAKSEARLAFGNDSVILERAIADPRHVEIQIMADAHGNAISLGERDCSVQRRHQKLIEEAPSPAVDPRLRAKMGAVSVKAALAIDYTGAGTFEYLLDGAGNFWFMEMNTRLQVEHPVTEAVTGLDLVELQLRIAGGEKLPLSQNEVQFSGHAIEVRLCAEDPGAGFLPQAGRMALWRTAPKLRTDHAMADGAAIPPFYDSMIAKLIAHAPDRDGARAALIAGLSETHALGIRTNQAFLGACLAHPDFAGGKATTDFIARTPDLLARDDKAEGVAAMLGAALSRAAEATGLAHGFGAPLRLARGETQHRLRVHTRARGLCRVEMAGASFEIHVTGRDGDRIDFTTSGRSDHAVLHRVGETLWLHHAGRAWDFTDLTLSPERIATDGGDGTLRAAMNGTITAVAVKPGDRVRKGDALVTLEAMKMEHAQVAGISGIVAEVKVTAGQQVTAQAILVVIVPDAAKSGKP